MAPAPVLLLALAGCGGGHEGHDPAGSASSAVSAPVSSAAGAGTAAATPTGSFNQRDVLFAANMIMHHRQALDMSALAETRAAGQPVKDLAAAVSAAQAPEIETLSGWLTGWGEQVPEDMSSMDMSGAMPGMQSLADLEKLADLEGAAFDRQFLTMMLAHHEGAVTMAKAELQGGSDPATKKLAEQVVTTQTAEIEQIRSLLA